MKSINDYLFRPIDNISLVLFRICFGFLVVAEAWGALITGWVKSTFITPEFTFNFIGFDFLQPLPGNGMYLYFFVMGLCGWGILLGYRFRLSSFLFALMWSAVYLMQKTSYNNHYYLLMILAFAMSLSNAHGDLSLDVKQNRIARINQMPTYIKLFVIIQLLIVYEFASIAKLYNDWLDLSFIDLLLGSKKNMPIIGPLLQYPVAKYSVAYFGIIYDALIIPALLYKPTQKIAIALSFFFHLFNSIVFQIGIFPYMSLAFMLFFIDPAWLKSKSQGLYHRFNEQYQNLQHKNTLVVSLLLLVHFVVQLALPLRHHFIQGDVLWTEEGHRLSWRMMLRTRQGSIQFFVTDVKTGRRETVDLNQYLTAKQISRLSTLPDYIWQFSQRLKKEYNEKGKQVAIHVKSKVSVNRGPYAEFIDPNVDLADTEWYYFRHNPWILPKPLSN